MVLKAACLASLIACGFALAFFPIQSKEDATLASLTIAFDVLVYSNDLYVHRRFDFPTGSNYLDIPVWLVDLSLLGLSISLLVALYVSAAKLGDEEPFGVKGHLE